MAARMRELANYGSKVKYVHRQQGFNSRLDELQAAVLRVKLRHLDGWNAARREVARAYCDGLASSALVLPAVDERAGPVWHLFVVRTPDRDILAAHLRSEGVETQIHYPIAPADSQAYLDLPDISEMPLARRLSGEVLSLPMGPHLDTAQISHVVQICNEHARASHLESTA